VHISVIFEMFFHLFFIVLTTKQKAQPSEKYFLIKFLHLLIIIIEIYVSVTLLHRKGTKKKKSVHDLYLSLRTSKQKTFVNVSGASMHCSLLSGNDNDWAIHTYEKKCALLSPWITVCLFCLGISFCE
jgi:hypothetical protein